MSYDAIIIGGGIAGLQAALQLGRYMHRVAVIDAGFGRSVLCRRYHNLLGWPEGVSGELLRSSGRLQAERVGVLFIEDEVIRVKRQEAGFIAFTKNGKQQITGSTMLLATGVIDRFYTVPGLMACLGLTVYVCPDCDGYEVLNRSTIVMGSGEIGAKMALALLYWTNQLTYVNHERVPVAKETFEKLAENGITVVDEPVLAVLSRGEGQFSGVELHSGKLLPAERGFLAFGGNQVRSELAHQLGAERMENGHIITDPRTKMTSIQHLWAAGDIGVHSEMVTVAMAEGSIAAVWIHKALVHMGKKGVKALEQIPDMQKNQVSLNNQNVIEEADANATNDEKEAMQAVQGAIARNDEGPDEC